MGDHFMNDSLSPKAQQDVREMTGHMNFVGIMGIILGALNCLSIIGAIIGVPYIIASLRIREAADNFNRYLNEGSTVTLEMAFEKQKSAFFITKVMLIIGLVLAVVGIIFFLATMAMVGTMPNQY